MTALPESEHARPRTWTLIPDSWDHVQQGNRGFMRGPLIPFTRKVEVIELEPVLDLCERWLTACHEAGWRNVPETNEAETLLREHGRLNA